MPRKIAAGNWKMNGSLDALKEIRDLPTSTSVDVLICPPFPYLAQAQNGAGDIRIGAQDCHMNEKGAHTGDVSASMLADLGVKHVIIGHSERRTDHHETDEIVAAKTKTAWDAGLFVILCIGESAAERESGATLDVITRQLGASIPDGASAKNLIVAYEPIWAIGTGAVATPDQIGEVHAAIRNTLEKRFSTDGADISLLYGGSVKAANAADIFAVADVDGALVGGASLKAQDFAPIITALTNA